MVYDNEQHTASTTWFVYTFNTVFVCIVWQWLLVSLLSSSCQTVEWCIHIYPVSKLPHCVSNFPWKRLEHTECPDMQCMGTWHQRKSVQDLTKHDTEIIGSTDSSNNLHSFSSVRVCWDYSISSFLLHCELVYSLLLSSYALFECSQIFMTICGNFAFLSVRNTVLIA